MKYGCLIRIALALAVFGCSKKAEKPPEKTTVETVKVAVETPQGLQPGIEFFDRGKQQHYEALFREYLAMFEAPSSGSSLCLKLWNGKYVGGQVEVLRPDSILMMTDGGAHDFKITDLAMESRAQIFAGEFARSRAMGRITGELDTNQTTTANSGTRYLMTDDVVAHVGPGAEFRRIDNVHLASGQAVKTAGERNGWLQLLNADGGGESWIPKYLTFDLDEMNYGARQSDVESLQKSGLLIGVDAMENVVDVDPNIWHGTDPKVRLGIARTLAAYCAAARSNNLAFVTIRDKETQKKLGKYSRGQGWKEMTL